MRLLSYLVIMLLMCSPFSQVQAARKWKNPDQAEVNNKAAAPVRIPAPKSGPAAILTGQLSLEGRRICDYQLSYIDKGSGGRIDGSFYLPHIPAGYSIIGAYAQGNYHSPSDCILVVKPANEQSRALLMSPQSWQRLWKDKGSGANMDGSFWHPSPPANDYVCLGSIASKGYKQPVMANYACVHRCLVENNPAASPVWSTGGTGANQKAYVYKLHNSNSFYVTSDKRRPSYLQDIKGNMSCTF